MGLSKPERTPDFFDFNGRMSCNTVVDAPGMSAWPSECRCCSRRTPGCCHARNTQRRVLDRHANEYKSRSRRDDDGGGGDDGDDDSNAAGQRGNSGDGGGDDDGDGSIARPVLPLASLPRRSARHLSSTHSVHPESAPGDRDNWSVACFV
jgi:hypothetical protein